MKKKSFKIFICTFLIALGLFGLARVYYALTDDFRLGNITYEMSGNNWQTKPITTAEQKNLALILNQKFHYIGKGAQCYAFVSDDQQYVLKFFKFKHLRPNWLTNLIPSLPLLKEYKKNIEVRKKRKLDGVFTGYELAYNENKEGSKLIYLHLAPTNFLRQKVTVVDKLGIEREINLDDVVFLVQNKGEILRSRMRHFLTNNKVEDAKDAIGNVLAMYITEYKKGLYDKDHGIMHNTGFIGKTPFHLDVGKFTKDETMKNPEIYKKDLEHVVWKIAVWTEREYPAHYKVISDYLANQYQNYTGYPIDINGIDPKKYKKRR